MNRFLILMCINYMMTVITHIVTNPSQSHGLVSAPEIWLLPPEITNQSRRFYANERRFAA